MAEFLDHIDASLEDIEEQLLQEFDRVRNLPSDGRYAVLDESVWDSVCAGIDDLHRQLEGSGDPMDLQLVSLRHEILYSRIAVLRQLMTHHILFAYLGEANEAVKPGRRQLEIQVLQHRKRKDRIALPEMPEAGTASPQRLGRNRIRVTRAEELVFAGADRYQDNGIYSASRELAVLANLVGHGTTEVEPAPVTEAAAPRRAIFESRELRSTLSGNNTVTPIKEPVQKPRPEKVVRTEKAEKRDIAQTPEDIRRKLEARRHDPAAGKAVFASKDIYHASPPPERPPVIRPEPKEVPEPPRTGKAVFASKDIIPVVPPEVRRRPEPKVMPPKKVEPPRTGPAVFESRDLSAAPIPKKD